MIFIHEFHELHKYNIVGQPSRAAEAGMAALRIMDGA